ncbi:MAG TPA: PAS domain S-box protein [Planctomycetaceae bacterium]|nr:PAS domain S-box protein [Planctomycetaceae bacterium]
MERFLRTRTARYGIAAASVALATWVRWLLDPVLEDRVPFATYFVAVVFTSWYGGLGPGLVCVGLGALSATRFFIPPSDAFVVRNVADGVALSLFLFLGGATALISGAMQTSQSRAARLAHDAERERRRFETTLASIGDAVIVTGPEGRVTFINAVAEALTGWPAFEADGQPLERVFRIVDERTGEPAGSPAARVLREGRIVGLANHTLLIARDGTRRAIDDSAAPIRGERGQLSGVVLVFRDVSARRAAERRRAARLAVTHVLAHEESIREAAPRILEAVCQALTWDFGALWKLDRDDQRLTCVETWRNPSVDVGEFETVTRQITFRRGEGLPGRIWDSGRPAWIADVVHDANFPRAAVAERAGVHGAFGFPVLAGDELLGIVEFFSREIREPDDDLLEMSNTIGGQIGLFIERTEAETRLRRSEQELSDFFENSAVGLHWVGPDGTILRVNQAELDLLGYARDEYVGRHIAEFHADPDTIDEILRRLACGETLQSCEARLRCKDGSIKHVLIDSNVLWDEGRFVHTRCFTRDITEQKRSERALRDSEERLRLALLAGGMGTWEWNVSTGAVVWSPGLETIHGLPPGGFSGSFEAFQHDIHPEDRERVLASIRETVATGREHHIEYRIVRPDGEQRWVEGCGRLFRDASGQPQRMVGVCSDITARKAAEQELREADRRKDDFLAMLGHELRNPLAPIRSGLDILAMSDGDPARSEIVTVMKRQVEHLVRLVDDLLDVSRIMRGKIELRPEPVELASIVATAVETVRPAIAGRNQQLTVRLPEEPLWLHADAVRIAQVLDNLLANASKYTDSGGRIELSAALDDDRMDGRGDRNQRARSVVICVSDTGMGIDPELLPRIFDLFTQSVQASDRSQGGLGIGLTLVRSLVELHGGTVSAASAGPGQGSRFTVRLPVGTPHEPVPVAPPAPPRSIGRRVLVVDDNVGATRMLSVLLEKLGPHEVEVAHDGHAALDKAGRFHPHLVLLDIGLPGMDGFQVAGKLREREDLRGTLLVALTGYGQEKDRRRSIQAGFDEHVVKPPSVDILQRLLCHPKLESGEPAS